MSVLSAGTKGGGSFGFDLGGGGGASFSSPGPQAPIQGGLPFSNAGGQYGGELAGLFPGIPGASALGTDYVAAYNAALALNQQNYQNILRGYQDTFSAQQARERSILAGYGDLTRNVLGSIQGVDASQRQAIQDAYAQQQGQALQGLTSAGLGNTTVTSAVNRGLGLDQQKAQIALANQFAQLQAGYQSQLGGAGLAFQNQANLQDTALSQAQLNFMNSVNSPYPNVSDYSNILNQAGYYQQQQLLNNYLGLTGGGARLAPAFSGGIGRAPSAPYIPSLNSANPGGASGQLYNQFQSGNSAQVPQGSSFANQGGGVDTSFLGAVAGAAPEAGAGLASGFALGGGAGLAAGFGGGIAGLYAAGAAQNPYGFGVGVGVPSFEGSTANQALYGQAAGSYGYNPITNEFAQSPFGSGPLSPYLESGLGPGYGATSSFYTMPGYNFSTGGGQ